DRPRPHRAGHRRRHDRDVDRPCRAQPAGAGPAGAGRARQRLSAAAPFVHNRMLPEMSGPLLVVDAPSMLFRAFYALPDSITGPDGTPVNALLGTANLILREVELHDPRAVVLCFGPDAADYRVELFPAYH